MTGCYDRVEMDDRTYVITIGVDGYQGENKVDENNLKKRFSVTLGSTEMSVGKNDNNSDRKNEIPQEINSGTTLEEALRAGDKFSSKTLYYGQLKIALLGDEILNDRDLFYETIQYLEKNEDINGSILVLGCEGKASDIMKNILSENTSAGFYIWDFYKSGEGKNDGLVINLHELVRAFNQNQSTLLPLISIENENVVMDKSVIVDNYIKKGILDSEQKSGSRWIKGLGENEIIQIECDGNYIYGNVDKIKSSFDFYEQENSLNCVIRIDADISIDGIYKENKYILEQKFKQTLISQAQKALEVSKISQCDFLGILQHLKYKNLDLYEKYNYKDINFLFDTNINIVYAK